MSEIVLLIGGLVVLKFFEAWLRSRASRTPQEPKEVPWFHCGLCAICLAAMSFRSWTGNVKVFHVIMAACLLWALGYTVWQFYKQRPQFSIKSMLLTTLLVAVVCSASHYVPTVPLIVVLTAFAGVWTAYRCGRYNEAVPTSPGRCAESPLDVANRGKLKDEVMVQPGEEVRLR